MNREESVAAIRYECIAIEGFLAKLRGREFSQQHYDKLLTALLAYREIIREQDWIEREVACCLYYLDLDLRASLETSPRNEIEHTLIKNTQLECSSLVLEILTPEYMTGPVPNELLK
jgi:hypothetical protein